MFNFQPLLTFLKRYFIFLTAFFFLTASFLLNSFSDQADFFSQPGSVDSAISKEFSQLLSAPFSNESLSLAFELRKSLGSTRLELEKFILVCLWQNQRFKDFAPRARAYLMVEKDAILSYLLYSLGENSPGLVDTFNFSWYDRLKFFLILQKSELNRLSQILFFMAVLLFLYAPVRHRFKSDKTIKIPDQIPFLQPEESTLSDTNTINPEELSQSLEKSIKKEELSEKNLSLPITQKPLEFKKNIADPNKKEEQSRELFVPALPEFGRFLRYIEPDLEKDKIKTRGFSVSTKKIEILKPDLIGIAAEFSIISVPESAQIITGSFTKRESSQEELKNAILEEIQEFLLPASFEAKALSDYTGKDDLANFYKLIEALKLDASEANPTGITSSSDITNLATFVIDLGRALTEMKRKVLLIDLDFTNPKLNHFTNEPCLYSLKDFLKDPPPDKSVFIKSIIENIFILHSGISSEQNLALINNESFWKNVLQFARKHFDNLLIMLPDINQLGKIKLQQEEISYLILIDENSTRSKFEFLDAWVPLRNYDMKLFTRIKCQLKS